MNLSVPAKKVSWWQFAAALAALSVALPLLPAAAQDAERRPSLAEVMEGATAMATAANAFLFVTNAEGGWVCALNVSSNHFAAIARGDEVVADQTTPSTICVPATHFTNAME